MIQVEYRPDVAISAQIDRRLQREFSKRPHPAAFRGGDLAPADVISSLRRRGLCSFLCS
jgi:hypothetical protein